MPIRNRYQIMNNSSQTDNEGNAYKDIMTHPINSFIETEIPLEVILVETDIKRFDLFLYKYYQSVDYDDFILWYNNIIDIHDLSAGDHIKLPSITDIENFYITYIQKTKE